MIKFYFRGKIYFRGGAVAISTILIVGIIVIEIAIASLIASYLASQSGLGDRLTANASFAAQSGIDDSIMKIARNKDLPTSTSTTLGIGSATANIYICNSLKTVTNPCDTSAGSGNFEITSLGRAANKQVRIRALLYVDPYSGLIIVKSIQEIST